MKNSQIFKEKGSNIIYEQVLNSFTCLRNYIEKNELQNSEFVDRIEIYLEPGNTSGLRFVFYKLNSVWKRMSGTTTQKEGKWSCDGSDNYSILAGNERYSSKINDWVIIDPVFTCILNDMVDRHMDYSVKDGQFIVPFKNGAHYVFEKDYKWSNVLTSTGRVLYSGTWKCDGDDEYEISSEGSTYSSKRGWNIKE